MYSNELKQKTTTQNTFSVLAICAHIESRIAALPRAAPTQQQQAHSGTHPREVVMLGEQRHRHDGADHAANTARQQKRTTSAHPARVARSEEQQPADNVQHFGPLSSVADTKATAFLQHACGQRASVTATALAARAGGRERASERGALTMLPEGVVAQRLQNEDESKQVVAPVREPVREGDEVACDGAWSDMCLGLW